MVRDLNFVTVKFMGQHFATFSHRTLYFLGHGASSIALIAIAETKTLSLPLKAILFIGAMFPKDAFPSTNVFNWPCNNIDLHFGDHSEEKQIM